MFSMSRINFILVLLSIVLVSCSSVTVKKPVEYLSENVAERSLILIRLAASVNGKLVDTTIAPVRGGRGAYKLTITNLATKNEPEILYPRTERSAAPSEQAKSKGWIYFSLPPGDYDLEVSTGTFTSAGTMVFLPKHYRLHVGEGNKVIYGGSFFAKCHDSIMPDCHPVDTQVDESREAELIAKVDMASPGRFVTALLQPYVEKLSGQLTDIEPIGLVVQHQDKLETPPWISRGMSRFTGIGNPGRVYTPPQSFCNTKACGEAAAGVVTLYSMYLPLGSIMGAIYGKYTETKWQPCMNSIRKEIYDYDFASNFSATLNKTFSSRKLHGPSLFKYDHDPLEEAEKLGYKSIIKAEIQRIQLRECSSNGNFCVEIEFHFSVINVKNKQTLYSKTLLYSESDAGRQDRSYITRTLHTPSCYGMEFLCNSPEENIRTQFMFAMNVLADEVASTMAR